MSITSLISSLLHFFTRIRLIEAFAEYGVKAKQVSCGGKHTLILTDDGEVLSFGVGEYGRLGTGSNDDALVPMPLDNLAEEEVTHIAAGFDHSLILTKDGKIFTWGRNNLGQLGHSDSYIGKCKEEERFDTQVCIISISTSVTI